jgi:hypothetical protein
MNIEHLIASRLLRLYPKRWRREYGAELLDVVLARPLTIRAVADPLRGLAPNPWAIMIAPLARLPESWLLGAFAGQVARWTVRLSRGHARP